MRNGAAGLIVAAALVAAGCGSANEQSAMPATTTTVAAPATTVNQSTTITPEPPSIGVEPLSGLLRGGDVAGYLTLTRPGSHVAASAEVGFTAGDGSLRSDDAIEVFGPAINEVTLIGTGWVNHEISGLMFHTEDPASVVETVLSDPRWPTPEPVESGPWTIWKLGDEIDLTRRSLVRPSGAGGQLAVGREGTEVEGWIAFESDPRARDGRVEIEDAGPAFAAAAPLMTTEWDSAVIQAGSFDVAESVARCTSCDESDFDRLRELYGPARTIRDHVGMIYLVNPEQLQAVILHADESSAEVNELLVPFAIANTQDEGQPRFRDVLAFAKLERLGTMVTIDFDIIHDRIDPISVVFAAQWTYDASSLWGPG